jgi:uncharacterized membrane protein
MNRTLPLPYAPQAVTGLLLLAVAAFWIPYVTPLNTHSRYVHFHVVTMVVWMGLVIVQPLLMRAGRMDWHRTMGKTTYLLMPLVVVSGVLLAHHRISQPGQLDQPGMLSLLVIQLFSPLVLAAFYALALANKRAPAVHARWMLATALLLIDPIVARVLMFHIPTAIDAADWLGPLLAMGAAAGMSMHDRRAANARHVFPIALTVLAIQLALFYTLGHSAFWKRFAHAFIALPLT